MGRKGFYNGLVVDGWEFLSIATVMHVCLDYSSFICLHTNIRHTHTHTHTSLTWRCAEDERWSLVGPADVVLRLDEQLVVGVGPEAVEDVVHHGRIAVVLHDVILVLRQRLLDLPRVRHNLHLTMQEVSFKYTTVF